MAIATAPTRERILVAARALFAEQGYRGTSVGDIEKAAGLAPRRGALYKHFPSKEALLRAVMAKDSEAVAAIDADLDTAALAPAEQLETLARLGLDELRREHELTRIVMKEGDRFPELASAFCEAIVEPGHRLATAWITAQAVATGAEVADPDALAAVMLDSLVGYTLQETLFGPAAGGIDDERFLSTWVRTVQSALEMSPRTRSEESS